MSDEAKLSLKLMVNKENNKVLFAEAGSDFADVLLSFLTLPLGKIVRLINNHYGNEAPALGTLTNMYNCLPSVNDSSFWSAGGKQMLLDPASSFTSECTNLKINLDDTKPATKFFRCDDLQCGRIKRQRLIARYHDSLKCYCGKFMKKPMGVTAGPGIQDGGAGGVFVKKGSSFLITDDLKMVSVVPDSIIQTLFNLGVTITSGAQIRTVHLGLNEVMNLLRASLLSNTPLTDVIFNRKIDKMDGGAKGNQAVKRESSSSSSSSDSKKIILYALIRKTDNSLHKLVDHDGDFVDFLVSLLTIPLGGVEWLLGGDSGLKSVDNLYRSIKHSIDEKCFRMPDIKSRLMKPKLPPDYLSGKRIFSLEEEVNPLLCYFKSVSTSDGNKSEETSSWINFKDPKGGESFVKSLSSFFITNDLTVRHVSDFVAREQKVLITSLNVLELHIGLEEGLDILRASLRSGLAFKICVANLISKKLNNK